MAVLAIQMRSNFLHCLSHAITVARKATRQMNADPKTRIKKAVDVLKVKAEDVMAEDAAVDAKHAGITRKATRQMWCVSNAETRGTTHMNTHRQRKT